MQRSASFVLVTLLASTLAACEDRNTGTTGAAPTGQAGSAAGGLKCGHPLVMWPALSGDELQFAKDQGKVFEQQTGIQVKLLEVPFADLQKKFIQAVPSGQGPDLLYGPSDWAGTLVEGGFVADLSGKVDTAKYLEPTVKAANYKGKLIGVPEAFEAVTQYHNTKLLPEPLKSFEDAKAAGEKLAEGQSTLVYDITNFYFSVAFLHAVGGTLFDDQGSFALTEEAATKWLTALKTLKETAKMPKELTGEAATTLFLGGKSGAYFSGPWAVADIKKSPVEWKLAKLPQVGGSDAKPFLGVKLMYLSSKSDCAPAALALAEHFSSAKVELAWNTKTNPAHLPALKAAYDDPALKDNATVQGFRAQAETSVPFPNLPAMGQVWTPGEEALKAVLNQGTDPAEAAKKMVADIKANIAKQK